MYLDPASGRELDVRKGPVGSAVEDRGADTLGFIQPVDRCYQGIVVRFPNGPYRWFDPLQSEALRRPVESALRACIRVVNQAAGLVWVVFTALLP